MPFPLIPVAIAGAVALASAAVALLRPKLVGLLDGKSVAILGGRQVGKTTLLDLLASSSTGTGIDAPSPDPPSKFALTVNGKRVEIEVPMDVSGSSRVLFTQWKSAFERADYVWYLFRADLIYAKDVEHIRRVKQDLDLMKDWVDGSSSKAPNVILIGTWADRIELFKHDAELFARKIRSSDPIRLGRKKFKGHATVIVGSVVGAEAQQLIADLETALS